MITNLRFQFICQPLSEQIIAGTMIVVIWGRSRQAGAPATWALCLRLVSEDGNRERGYLLPMTFGQPDKNPEDAFKSYMSPMRIGPLQLITQEAAEGDRLVLEVGSVGEADLETFEQRSYSELSHDIVLRDS